MSAPCCGVRLGPRYSRWVLRIQFWREYPDRRINVRKACPMTRELAFKVVNVPADFSALCSECCNDVRFGHCLFAPSD